MKRYFFAVFAVLVMTSCATKVYQLNAECPNKTTEDIFKSITTLLMQEGFTIKQADAKLGFLQAETTPEYDIWLGMTVTRVWIFQSNHDKIIAFAKGVSVQQNAFGATTGSSVSYCNNEISKEITWYWNVRDGLEKICGSKIVITMKESR